MHKEKRVLCVAILAIGFAIAGNPAHAGVIGKTWGHTKAIANVGVVKPTRALGGFAKRVLQDPIGASGRAIKTGWIKTYHGACWVSKKSEPLVPGVNLVTAGTNMVISAKAAGVKF